MVSQEVAISRPVGEAAILPDLPIVDSHIHLWTRDAYFASEFLADVRAGHNVEASIYVECSEAYLSEGPIAYRSLGETLHVVDQVRQAQGSSHDLAAGIVAAADLTLGMAVREVIDAQCDAADGRLRGVRRRIAWDADPVASYGTAGCSKNPDLSDQKFLKGASVLADMGLVLDLWGFHTQLEDMARFAATVPNLTVVVNHAGGPIGVGRYAKMREQVFEEWGAGIAALAALPNVLVKLSGFGIPRLGLGSDDPGMASSDQLADLWGPYIEACVEAFGIERSIFGSNFPVDRIAAPYSTVINAYKKVLSCNSYANQLAIFSGNARRIYSIPEHE